MIYPFEDSRYDTAEMSLKKNNQRRRKINHIYIYTCLNRLTLEKQILILLILILLLIFL